MTALAVSHHIALHRDLPVSRSQVWRAFADGDSLSEWFAPTGFHVPARSVRIDPRPGGPLRLTMVHNRDRMLRTDVDARFVEVEPGRRIVVEEDLHDGHPPMQLVVTLEDAPGGCHLSLEQGPYPEHILSAAAAGWDSSLGKLRAFLTGEPVEPDEAF